MKKFFSLVLALVMALSLTTVAWADVVPTGDYTFTSNTVDFDTTNDMSYVGSSSSTPYPAWIHYEGSADITIDLGGLTFNMPTGTVHVPVYIGGSGTVTITNGKIIGSTDSRCIVAVGGTATVNFENVEIVSNRPNGSGVAIFQMKGFDTTVNLFDGAKISAVGSYATTESYGELNVYDGAVVSYDSTGSNGNGTGSAIGVSGGTGVANIYGGTISTDATGADKSAVSTNTSGGEINIMGGTITGETAVRAMTDSYYNLPAEINISGGTINGALEETNYGGTADTEVVVSGGIFDNDVSGYLATGYEAAEVGSTGGTFVVGQDIDVDTDGNITGGTFNDDVSAYLAAGYTVVGGEIVKASNSYTGLYAGATSEGANVVAITSLNFFKANDNEVNEDGTYKADGNVAYYTVTGDQYFSGKYYVEVKTLAKADVVVYTDAAGKNVYMYLDQIEDPFYYGDGVVTKNFGTACGQYNAKNPAYDKKATYYVAFETLYVGDKVSPTEWLMVNGEMVGVDVAFDDVVAHAPVYTRDEDGEIVAIKCSKCGAVAVEAPNFLSMPKNADRVGTTLWYFPAAGAVGDTETKVESAETFDAGIAMYVGMSVMAAAGSAVVLKKKG